MEKHLVKVVVGDWSGDGHNITETTIIESNLTSSELYSAYIKGSKIVGFDLSECCSDYQDSKLQGQYIKMLRENGIDIIFDGRAEDPLDDEDDGVNLMVEEFVEIYLNICKLARPEFEWKEVRLGNLDIGGYGLMWT